MGLFDALKRTFGGGGERVAARADPVEYKGFLIYPEPRAQGGQFLTAGTIALDSPEGRKEHAFVRADTHASEDEARKFSVTKGQRIIDEQGERLFTSG